MSFDWNLFWATVKEDAIYVVPALVIYNVGVWIYKSRKRANQRRKWFETE